MDIKRPNEVKKFIHTMMKDKLKGTGVTVSMSVFLLELDETEGLSNRILSERAGVTKALTTRVTRQLEAKDLVEIRPNGRECSITLTPEGAKAREIAQRCSDECMEYLFSTMDESERKALHTIYVKMSERIDAYYAQRKS